MARSWSSVSTIGRFTRPPTLSVQPAGVTGIESETKNILGAVFELSGDVFWESVFRAFQMGFLDVPFSPHADNANKLVSMRDSHRSIRIADAGNVPISKADAAREKELLISSDNRLDKTYRQLLGDINMMME